MYPPVHMLPEGLVSHITEFPANHIELQDQKIKVSDYSMFHLHHIGPDCTRADSVSACDRKGTRCKWCPGKRMCMGEAEIR